jgi:hypothetical protein
MRGRRGGGKQAALLGSAKVGGGSRILERVSILIEAIIVIRPSQVLTSANGSTAHALYASLRTPVA